jgi:hypothetical protein
MNAVLGKLATDQVTNFIKESRLLAHDIKRQPLVVGFSTENDLNGEDSTDQVAEFGWLIGPKFDLEEDDDVEFRHVPITNTLSALISAPSWWTNAEAKITVCWLSPYQNSLVHVGGSDAVCKAQKASGSSQSSEEVGDLSQSPVKTFSYKYELSLPGDASEIKRKLQYEVGHVPHIDSDYIGDKGVLAKFYVEQEEVQLLIRGQDLWRSTVVTMGAQKAYRIEVLPDMHGIIAHFKKVEKPISWEYVDNQEGKGRYDCYGDLEVVVWTSEGRTEERRFVRVYQTEDQYKAGECVEDQVGT